jgi:hypothetical protein
LSIGFHEFAERNGFFMFDDRFGVGEHALDVIAVGVGFVLD